MNHRREKQMTERRYLIILIHCVVFGPASGYGIKFERFVGTPSEPYYTFLLGLDLLLNHQGFLLLRFDNLFKFGLTYEVSDASGKIPHSFKIYLKVVGWKPKLLVDIEPLFFPGCIYRVEVQIKLTKSFPFAHDPLVYFFTDCKDEIL